MKKIGFLAFACLLFIQAVLPVMAQLNLSEIDPNQLGSITIHRFAGSTSTAPTTGTPLNGIPYTIQLVRLIPGTEPTPANLTNPGNYEEITGEGAFRATGSTVNGIASFTDLPHGIFLVTEDTLHTVTPASDRVPPFIVGIPRRAIVGEEEVWVYDVDVYPKSEADADLVFTKDVEMDWDAQLDDLVATWELQTVVPRLIGNATRVEFVDELDDRLTFIEDSVIGTFLRMENVDGTQTEVETTLQNNVHFQVSVETNNELRIALTQSGFTTLAQNAILAPNGTLTFTFRTSVSMLEADLGDITNEALLFYNTTNPTDAIRATGGPVTQFAMEIEKINVNGRHLSGAVFEVSLDEDGDYPAFPNATGNRQFTTTDGIVFIPGLQAGTYYLHEIAAPEGFRLIAESMRVTVDSSHADDTRDYVILLQIINEVEGGFILPETGGVGTILFTVVGLALIGGAVSLAMIAKRRRGQHD